MPLTAAPPPPHQPASHRQVNPLEATKLLGELGLEGMAGAPLQHWRHVPVPFQHDTTGMLVPGAAWCPCHSAMLQPCMAQQRRSNHACSLAPFALLNAERSKSFGGIYDVWRPGVTPCQNVRAVAGSPHKVAMGAGREGASGAGFCIPAGLLTAALLPRPPQTCRSRMPPLGEPGNCMDAGWLGGRGRDRCCEKAARQSVVQLITETAWRCGTVQPNHPAACPLCPCRAALSVARAPAEHAEQMAQRMADAINAMARNQLGTKWEGSMLVRAAAGAGQPLRRGAGLRSTRHLQLFARCGAAAAGTRLTGGPSRFPTGARGLRCIVPNALLVHCAARR